MFHVEHSAKADQDYQLFHVEQLNRTIKVSPQQTKQAQNINIHITVPRGTVQLLQVCKVYTTQQAVKIYRHGFYISKKIKQLNIKSNKYPRIFSKKNNFKRKKTQTSIFTIKNHQ